MNKRKSVLRLIGTTAVAATAGIAPIGPAAAAPAGGIRPDVPCGTGSVTVYGGYVYYDQPCSHMVNVTVVDTEKDGKCANVHVWGDGYADMRRRACGQGHQASFTDSRRYASLPDYGVHITLAVY